MIYDNVVLQTTLFLFKVTYGAAIGFYNKGFHPFFKATYAKTPSTKGFHSFSFLKAKETFFVYALKLYRP